MNNRERFKAIMNYEKYDRMPIVHFGFWYETLDKWADQGHITKKEAKNWIDGNEYDKSITKKMGFDFNYYTAYHPNTSLNPPFEEKIIERMENGSYKLLNHEGVVVLGKDDAGSIPAEIAHTLVDRKSWEDQYLPRLRYSSDRFQEDVLLKFKDENDKRDYPLGLYSGSLMGNIRNYIGVVNLSYLYYDDPDLYIEIVDTVADLSYKLTKEVLSYGVDYDFGHFWEDICFKNGPLVVPSVFDEVVGKHYKRITDLYNEYGINIVSLDCDGLIDALIPTWFENGVNTMFPIEVGTWNASIEPWREEYGKDLRGVGGMNKTVFSMDKKDIEKEVMRLEKLVKLGGYIPCPDHRIAPDAKWENVVYYTKIFEEMING